MYNYVYIIDRVRLYTLFLLERNEQMIEKFVAKLSRIWIAALVLILVISLTAVLPEHAYGADTGSISFGMYYGDTLVGGGELALYRIERNGSHTFVRNVTIGSDGKAKADGLTPGWYYIEQTRAAKGYSKISPFRIEVVSGKTSDAEPKMSVTPETPSNPSGPDEPDNPNNPDTPDNPDNPSTPDNPDNPSNPDNPDNPNEPDQPNNPNNPDNPSDPDEPDQPDNPNTPDNPSEPDQPDNPNNPNSPDTPTSDKKKLPQTGQLWWPVWLLSGTGIILIVAGLFVHMKRTRE